MRAVYGAFYGWFLRGLNRLVFPYRLPQDTECAADDACYLLSVAAVPCNDGNV